MDRSLPLDAHRGAADDVSRDAAEAYGAQDYPAAERGWTLARDYFVANGNSLEAAAADMLSRAPLALAGAKRAVAAAAGSDWPTVGAEQETAELMALFASADGAEGIAAFVEKRPAQFTGA